MKNLNFCIYLIINVYELNSLQTEIRIRVDALSLPFPKSPHRNNNNREGDNSPPAPEPAPPAAQFCPSPDGALVQFIYSR